ncbi:hypothetical protein BM532_19780, partial [Clostridioides difficile]
ENVRSTILKLIDGDEEKDSVIYVKNATEGINFLAKFLKMKIQINLLLPQQWSIWLITCLLKLIFLQKLLELQKKENLIYVN